MLTETSEKFINTLAINKCIIELFVQIILNIDWIGLLMDFNDKTVQYIVKQVDSYNI